MLSFCGEGGGSHSHFHVQSNYSVEVVLCCVVVGVVTKLGIYLKGKEGVWS